MVMGIKCSECGCQVSTGDFYWHVVFYLSSLAIAELRPSIEKIAISYFLQKRGFIDKIMDPIVDSIESSIDFIETGMAVCADKMQLACPNPNCKKVPHWELIEIEIKIENKNQVVQEKQTSPDA